MWDLIVLVPDHCLSFYFSFVTAVARNRDKVTMFTSGLLNIDLVLHHFALLSRAQSIVVRSIVNLTSPLRGKLVKCFTT